jgi:hypothetical protein
MKNISEISHDRLLTLVRYDPISGNFYKNSPRKGCISENELGYVHASGYRRICVDYSVYQAHRLAWFYVHGMWPPQEIDHKNLCKHDNRIENLRLASRAQNHANTPARFSKSGLKGAYWYARKGRWRSQIQINGKVHFLGLFDNPEDAHKAYIAAHINLYGTFARTA